jgi:hypothetical protein
VRLELLASAFELVVVGMPPTIQGAAGELQQGRAGQEPEQAPSH